MKKVLLVLASLLLVGSVFAGCGKEEAPAPEANGNNAPAENVKIVVGATAKPHAEILEVVKPILANEGIDLEIKTFTDYAQLNPALNEGQIDANFFQHIPYLEDYNANNGTDLVWVAQIHNEPMGIYSKKLTDIAELADGATVGIPNDTTNCGRALMVLESAGLITLKEDAGVGATEGDIVDNPKNLTFQQMDAAMLPRALEDMDICVINSNYAIEGGLNPVQDALVMEPTDSPFGNVLVVRAEDKDNENIAKLVAAMQSDEVRTFIEDTYQGSCVPCF
jgi:D-methionine transport system substrate-binding protein